MANEINNNNSNNIKPGSIQKGGRAPLKQKGSTTDEMRIGGPGPFEIPASVKSELKQKGLKERWIDMAQLKAKGGYHKGGWTPIQFDCLKGSLKSNPFIDSSLDGFLIRNGMVLAVNTLESVAQKQAYKKQRTQIQSGRQSVKEFKDFIKTMKLGKIEEDDGSED